MCFVPLLYTSLTWRFNGRHLIFPIFLFAFFYFSEGHLLFLSGFFFFLVKPWALLKMSLMVCFGSSFWFVVVGVLIFFFYFAYDFHPMESSKKFLFWVHLMVLLFVGLFLCSLCQEDSDEVTTAVYIVTLKQAPSVHQYAQELIRLNNKHRFNNQDGNSSRLTRFRKPRCWIFLQVYT